MPTLKHLTPTRFSKKTRVEIQPSRVLCLDLGTNTGFARLEYPTEVDIPTLWHTGTYDLQPHYKGSKAFHKHFRLFEFKDMLRALCLDSNGKCNVEMIAYEVVVGKQAGGGSDAAHLWGTWESLLLMFCAEHDICLVGYGVTEIKNRFTGSGSASKEDMMSECNSRGKTPGDDNEADAIALAFLLTEDLAAGVISRIEIEMFALLQAKSHQKVP